MLSTLPHLTLRAGCRAKRIQLLSVLLAAIFCALAVGPVLAADPPAPNPLLPLVIANFATSGVEPSVGVAATATLKAALAGQPQLDLKTGPRVNDLIGSYTARVLANRPEAARTVADQLGARVLLFGVIGADAAGGRFMQMTAVDCRPHTPRLYALPAQPWPDDPAAQKTTLLSSLQALLPPAGRVLMIASVGGQTSLQLFPFAGMPLRTSATYLAYHALTAEASPERPDYLPLLWEGPYAAKLLTAADHQDDAINASSPDSA